MSINQASFERFVFYEGIVTHFLKVKMLGRGRDYSMIHIAEHRFSRCIKQIVVTKR